MFQVLDKTALVIREGGESGIVEVQSTFPPLLTCDANTPLKKCTMLMQVSVLETAKDLKCPGSTVTIPQVVAKWKTTRKNEGSCQLRLSSYNWRLVHQIIVTATVDFTYDKDQQRKLTISTIPWVNSTHQTTIAVDTVQVCLFTFMTKFTIFKIIKTTNSY